MLSLSCCSSSFFTPTNRHQLLSAKHTTSIYTTLQPLLYRHDATVEVLHTHHINSSNGRAAVVQSEVGGCSGSTESDDDASRREDLHSRGCGGLGGGSMVDRDCEGRGHPVRDIEFGGLHSIDEMVEVPWGQRRDFLKELIIEEHRREIDKSTTGDDENKWTMIGELLSLHKGEPE